MPDSLFKCVRIWLEFSLTGFCKRECRWLSVLLHLRSAFSKKRGFSNNSSRIGLEELFKVPARAIPAEDGHPLNEFST